MIPLLLSCSEKDKMAFFFRDRVYIGLVQSTLQPKRARPRLRVESRSSFAASACRPNSEMCDRQFRVRKRRLS